MSIKLLPALTLVREKKKKKTGTWRRGLSASFRREKAWQRRLTLSLRKYRVVKLGKTNLYGFLSGRLAINFTCYRVNDMKNFPLVSRTELVL